jgi:hypothetical protein
MDGHGEQTHFVKRVILPSGKTIEVVYFKQAELPQATVERSAGEAPAAPEDPPAERDQELHVCGSCASELVYPVQWEESGPTSWSVVLHCPNCDAFREGIFSQETVESLDDELDRGADALARDYKRLLRANMTDEVERFVGALNSDAILPEDF